MQVRHRLDARQLSAVREALTDQQRSVLSWLLSHRYASSHQLRDACYAHPDRSELATTRAASRGLGQLVECGLIRRLERRVGGLHGGSAAGIYQLSPGGYRVGGGMAGRFRSHEPSPRLLAHWLAIGDVDLHLRALSATGQGGASVDVEVEPASWRHYSGLGGEAKWLQPDLAAHVKKTGASGDVEVHYFIEVDLGTEGFGRLEQKALGYESYFKTGIEQVRLGVFPRVLWVFEQDTDGQRRERFAELVRRSARLTTPMHHATTLDGLSDVVREDLA